MREFLDHVSYLAFGGGLLAFDLDNLSFGIDNLAFGGIYLAIVRDNLALAGFPGKIASARHLSRHLENKKNFDQSSIEVSLVFMVVRSSSYRHGGWHSLCMWDFQHCVL